MVGGGNNLFGSLEYSTIWNTMSKVNKKESSGFDLTSPPFPSNPPKYPKPRLYSECDHFFTHSHTLKIPTRKLGTQFNNNTPLFYWWAKDVRATHHLLQSRVSNPTKLASRWWVVGSLVNAFTCMYMYTIYVHIIYILYMMYIIYIYILCMYI